MAIRLFSLCCCAFLSFAAVAQTTAYDRGPNGLEAWTDDHHTREFRTNTEPFGIVIARNGRQIRYIGKKEFGPFYWNVMLLPDGKRVAYEHGPFHFSMTCTLMDIASGKILETVSCFTEEEIATDPDWVKQLLASDRKPTASQTRSISKRSKR